MVYDDSAKKVAVKVIGTVESSLNYSAINYNDPITVGMGQWYGTRAAAILNRMKVENAAAWTGVSPSLDNNLATIDSSSTWWNSRYLTTTEGNTLVPVLGANELVQNTQMVADLDVYKGVITSWGFDPDANTDTVIFIMVMYHQGPQYALEVVQTVDSMCTLTQIYDACMAHPVFSQYPGRYTTARDMIAAHDNTGITLPGAGDPTPPPVPPVTGGAGGANNTGNVAYLEVVGGSVRLHYRDGQLLDAYPDGRGRFLPRHADGTDPAPPVDPPPVDPTPDTWTNPLPTGVISLGFGEYPWGGQHWGLDLSSPGSAGNVICPTDLILTVATDNGNVTAGTYVKGHTPDGAWTMNFYHMQYGSLRVRAGQTIAKGTIIGIEGATGNVTGRHLHFELYPGNYADPWPPPYGPTPVDPLPVLRSKGVNI